ISSNSLSLYILCVSHSLIRLLSSVILFHMLKHNESYILGIWIIFSWIIIVS
ncbi:hypothetical protein BDF21DRAFT_434844, partial [Thamnidium elegans]